MLQPQIDLLRPRLIEQPSKLHPKLLEPESGRWSLAFDGTGWINCNDDSSLQFTKNFILVARIKTTTTQVYSDLVSKHVVGSSPWPGWAFAVNTNVANGKLSFWSSTYGSWVQGDTVVNDGIGHLVAAVQKDTAVDFYVDGEFDAARSSAESPSTVGILPSIGANNAGNCQFDGLMEYLCVVDGIDNAAEIIRRLCENQITPADIPGLAGWWRFQEGFGVADGTQVRDWSGNNNHGSMQGFSGDPWVNVGVR